VPASKAGKVPALPPKLNVPPVPNVPPAPLPPVPIMPHANSSLKQLWSRQVSKPPVSHAMICVLQCDSAQLTPAGHDVEEAGGSVPEPVQPPLPKNEPPMPLAVPPWLVVPPPLVEVVPPVLELVPPELVPAPLPLPVELLEPPHAATAAQATTTLAIPYLIKFMTHPLVRPAQAGVAGEIITSGQKPPR
jgi:hypothetical protein